jgi:hypothetical protein
MTVNVTIRFEEEGDDREYQADLLAVPRVGEFISIGSLGTENFHRFEVEKVWHHHLDGKSGVDLFCRKVHGRRAHQTAKIIG